MAINGVYAVFKVEAVMNTVGVSRENTGRRQRDAKGQGRRKEDLFVGMLSGAATEDTEAPELFRSGVYGKDGRMAEAKREKREYRY